MSKQPRADEICTACGHYGAHHLRLLDMPPRCKCGCVDWDGVLPKFRADSWFEIKSRGWVAAGIGRDQLPEGTSATDLLNRHVVIDGHVYRVTGVEECRVNHICTDPFGLLVG